ncbi:phylloplanin-like [Castanea sativa]|uniref:phylloplanin-like n=1 Tax=Castanea sativa TaxID=21020 RepID=UPI003F6502B7
MALKSVLFISLMVAALAVPIAGAGLISGLLGLINIQGTLFCSLNGSANATATPVFPNALVQLQCGAGNVAASATTNSAGIFSIPLNPLQVLLQTLLSNCNLVVNTPLSSCNANLPSVESLASPLQYVGNTVLGLLNVANIIPAGFKPIPLT